MRTIVSRYLVFLTGLYLLALGVVLFVFSMLGTTPISSFNYILSLHTPLTLGMATFLFNIALIFVEFWLIRGMGTKKDRLEILAQIPASFVLGAFMDVNMYMLSGFEVSTYPQALALLACACVIQAVGFVLEVKPNVVVMSAEGVVKYAARRWGKEFGKVKVWFDVILVTIAAVASLAFSGTIEGLREGTVIAALCTGAMITFLSNRVFTLRTLCRLRGMGRRIAGRA